MINMSILHVSFYPSIRVYRRPMHHLIQYLERRMESLCLQRLILPLNHPDAKAIDDQIYALHAFLSCAAGSL